MPLLSSVGLVSCGCRKACVLLGFVKTACLPFPAACSAHCLLYFRYSPVQNVLRALFGWAVVVVLHCLAVPAFTWVAGWRTVLQVLCRWVIRELLAWFLDVSPTSTMPHHCTLWLNTFAFRTAARQRRHVAAAGITRLSPVVYHVLPVADVTVGVRARTPLRVALRRTDKVGGRLAWEGRRETGGRASGKTVWRLPLFLCKGEGMDRRCCRPGLLPSAWPFPALSPGAN